MEKERTIAVVDGSKVPAECHAAGSPVWPKCGDLGTNVVTRVFKGMSDASYRPRNRLLLALPPRNLKRLLPVLEPISCPRELVLMDAESSLDYIFFPEAGVISVLAVYADGNMIEMATIGREGCTGTQAILGAKISSARLLVQIPGSAMKLSRAAFTGGRSVYAALSKPYVRTRPGISRTGHGIRGVQWRTQSQAKACSLVADDA